MVLRIQSNLSNYFNTWILVVFGISAIALSLYTTSAHGVRTSPDSLYYISTARSLLNGEGLVAHMPAVIDVLTGGVTTFEETAEARPLTHWPPLYPISLAAIGLTGLDLFSGARYLNALLFGANVWLIGWLILREIGSTGWSLAASLAMITSPALLRIHSFAWSEPLFILLTTISLFLLIYHHRSNHLGLLILAGICSALAFLTRYIGVTVVLTGALVLVSFSGSDVWSRIKRTVLYGAVACLPMALWLIRNYRLTHFLTGENPRASSDLYTILLRVFSTSTHWFLPEGLRLKVRLGLVIVGFAVVILSSWYIHWRQRSGTSGTSHGKRLTPAYYLALGLFIMVYTFLLIIASTLVYFDAINDRLLAPIFPALVIIATAYLSLLSTYLSSGQLRFRRSNGVLVGLVCVWLLFSGYRAVQWVQSVTQ